MCDGFPAISRFNGLGKEAQVFVNGDGLLTRQFAIGVTGQGIQPALTRIARRENATIGLTNVGE